MKSEDDRGGQKDGIVSVWRWVLGFARGRRVKSRRTLRLFLGGRLQKSLECAIIPGMRTTNDELKELIDMRAAGALTEREFTMAKAKLLNEIPLANQVEAMADRYFYRQVKFFIGIIITLAVVAFLFIHIVIART